MAQGELPEIFGSDWVPKAKLDFTQPLLAIAARREVLLFVTQQHDGKISLVADIWDHLITSEPKQFEAPSWSKYSKRLIDGLSKGLISQLNSKMAEEKQSEVIPRRDVETYVTRRNTHFLLDMKLMLRRLAHYMSITVAQRLDWQSHMTRTRYMDCLLYTSPSPRDSDSSRMPSSA